MQGAEEVAGEPGTLTSYLDKSKRQEEQATYEYFRSVQTESFPDCRNYSLLHHGMSLFWKRNMIVHEEKKPRRPDAGRVLQARKSRNTHVKRRPLQGFARVGLDRWCLGTSSYSRGRRSPRAQLRAFAHLGSTGLEHTYHNPWSVAALERWRASPLGGIPLLVLHRTLAGSVRG